MNASRRSINYLVKRIWRYRSAGFLIILLGIASSLAKVSILASTKPLFDVLFTEDPEAFIRGMAWLPEAWKSGVVAGVTEFLSDRAFALNCVVGLFMGLAFLYVLFSAPHRYLSQRVAGVFMVDLFRDMYERMIVLPLFEVQKRKQGELTSRFSTDIIMMREAVQQFFLNLMRDPLMALFSLAACFLINWKITLIALFSFPLLGLVIAVLSRRIRKYSILESQAAAGLYQQISETLAGFAVVKAFQSEEMLIRRFGERGAEYLRFMKKVFKIFAYTPPILEFIGYSTMALVFWFLARDVWGGKLSAGDLFSFAILMGNVYQPVKSTSNALQRISRCLGGVDRYLQIYELEKEEDYGDENPPESIDEIEFKDLHFSYDEKSEVLRGFSATVKKGQTVALVGATGSGKTTLLSLMSRLYPFREGSLLVNGKPVQRIALSQWRKRLAVVTQNVFLFNDTVYNNIVTGTNASREEVLRAAEQASAHEFISKLPDGYETEVGDRGALLSGGQAQRISIARAILRNPDILLLDEATSALDAETERLVQNSLDELSKGRTTLVVAHRLSTVRKADCILVMEAGRVVEQGNHDSLIEKNGLYARLYRSFSNDD